MKHRYFVLLALGSVSACAWLVSACGGSDNTNIDGGGNDATTNDGATSDTSTSDTSTNDTGTTDGGSVDSGCAPGPGCRQCCTMKYPDATAAFATLEETCACTTPGDCKNACGNSLCQGKQASGQCTACLLNKDAGDCFATTASSCLADPSCAPLAQCVASCGNGGGPQDAGGGG